VAKLAQDKVFGNEIVTQITPAAQFHEAEVGHQEYYRRVGGGNPYCSYVIDPKVAKFRKKYFDRLKK
jgi:peptide-methionine (S)-S-oxide reductase